MELTVRKSDLLPELQLFQGIIERKNTIPILANVLIEANSDSTVQLLATDLEVGLRGRCQASVIKSGALTIPAKKLYEIVRALPDTEIHIKEGEKGSVKVSADQFDSRMQTLPREDFPTLPETTDDLAAVTLSRSSVREMVSKTQFAITGEDTRYFLNGALFILEPHKMNLVATDGHRLAMVSTARKKVKGEPEELQAILPKKTLLELVRLLVDGDDDLRYTVSENHLFFDVDGRQLISRVIDAQFPAYERVIPKSNNRKIKFERDRLTSAIKRVALLSNDRSRAVKFRIGKDRVDVTSSSPEVGEATETLLVPSDGEEVEICFNAQYILDFLSVADTENIELDLKDDVSQAVMRPIASEGCEYTYVIMPMRV